MARRTDSFHVLNWIDTNFVYTGSVKNITFSTDEDVLRRAREKALREKTNLNQLFRDWLARYLGMDRAAERYRELMLRLEGVEAGRTFSREEMNER